MNKDRLILNTLVYANQIAAGTARQADCLATATALGIRRVEIRRELLRDGNAELAALRKDAADRGIGLYYSLPTGLCTPGAVSAEAAGHLDEAHALGAVHAKWNIGTFTGNAEGLGAFAEAATKAGIRIDVENDQSDEGGTPEAVEALMAYTAAEKIDLGLTFDVGNWAMRGEDPVEMAARLAPHVRYIHVKDVATDADGRRRVVPVGKGDIDLPSVLEALPKDVPIAYEFRVPDDQVLATSIGVLFGE